MKSRGPPDGGYGWVVVTSAFFIMGLTAAVLKNFGLFFLDIQSHFGVLTSTTSWVTSTTIAMFHLGAPVASALTLQFSQRVVIIVGGLLSAAGMMLASLDLSLPWLYLTLGILQGVGISFSWIPANSMVSHYFVRWRPIAYAIASSGESVFAVLFSPLFQWLIETYSWQGALLIIGGLQLNLCVCGALMRPLEVQSPTQEIKEDLDIDAAVLPPKRKVLFQFSLMRKPELLLYFLFAVLAAAGFFIPPLFLVPFAHSSGMDKYWPASILSILASADLVGRLLCGWLANMRLVRNLQLLTMVVTLLGVVLLLLPVSHNYWAILVFASLYGFLFGCAVAIHVTAIVDIVGLEGFDSGLGLFMLFRSVGGFMGPPAAGWLVDQTHDHGAAFYLSGLCLISSAVFVVVVDHLVQKRKSVEAEVHQKIFQDESEPGKLQ
ncbi:monocarboxylate transporter 13 [Centropristis striata]|uniref:monocarboxylate transporter 13 n=1 Tax=Centropristis striata TaxID=184440 RepID=UPI0027DF7891|nr:monocarboxylate transporter 13 [Centropristis striata]XP_059192265.1 monocarboxylate transporter 13 [Centropristis striata]XP_059192266.1 monocarboxylate transporter 13 [Centropristis striata]